LRARARLPRTIVARQPPPVPLAFGPRTRVGTTASRAWSRPGGPAAVAVRSTGRGQVGRRFSSKSASR
jgi:hypothetical protein